MFASRAVDIVIAAVGIPVLAVMVRAWTPRGALLPREAAYNQRLRVQTYGLLAVAVVGAVVGVAEEQDEALIVAGVLVALSVGVLAMLRWRERR